MGIKMNYANVTFAVIISQGHTIGAHKRVIAAQDDGECPGIYDLAHPFPNLIMGILNIQWVHPSIAIVGTLQHIK